MAKNPPQAHERRKSPTYSKVRDRPILCEVNLGKLSRKIGTDIPPAYTSRKIGSEIKPKEEKPFIVNQQCVVYHFQCNLCDADY